MNNKFKIAISGIGGVGGYIGGMLAKRFEDSQDVEIYFIARGENEMAIRQYGLKLLTASGDFMAHPKLTTSDPNLIGPVDLLICCTKTYDLAEIMRQCAPCIHSPTIILPLLNGVDGREMISEIYPYNEICDGCIYIISQLIEPGIVKQSGSICKVYFATGHNTDARLLRIRALFTEAGIDATLSDHIQQIVWEKFVFISVMATLTSYLDGTLGTILDDPKNKDLMLLLLTEIKLVADHKHISFSSDIIQATLDKMKKLPKDTTSSMHRDFQNHKRTELESLTGYVVRAALEFRFQAPTYEMMYTFLKNKPRPN